MRRAERLHGRAIRLAAVLGCLAAVLAAGPAAGQVPDSVRADSARADTTVFEVEAIRVRATRPVALASGAAAVNLSLEVPMIQPVPLLADALREMPFVLVRENSRGEQQLTLRGTESRQIAVLIDGVPLTLGWDARTDLSLLPVAAATEVQLFRGLSSVLHGPNVLGGVVEVDITRGPTRERDPPAFRGEAGVDHTGATTAGAEVGHRFRPTEKSELVVRAGVGYRNRDDLPLASGVVQPPSLETERRLNSDAEYISGFLAARYGVEDGPWVSLSSFGFSAERGVAPELHIAAPRLWRIPKTSRWVTAVSAGTGWGSTPMGEGDLEASVGIDFGDSRIDSYETLAYETIEGTELADNRTLSFRLLGDHTLGGGTVRGAFTYAETRHVETLEPGGESRFRQRLFSLGAEVEQPLGSTQPSDAAISNFALTVGASLDGEGTPETGGRDPRDPITEWGARFGISALVSGGVARVHAGVSRRVRFPSLRELYSGALGRFIPNPELGPEKLNILEAGITGRGGIFEGQAVFFHQRFTDQIVRTSLGEGRFKRENRRRVTGTGLELLATLTIGRAALGGDITLQNVDQKDELALPGQARAEYQPEIFGSLELSAPIVFDVLGRAGLRYVGTQYCVNPDLAADEALDPSGRLDLLLTRDWPVGGSLGRLRTTLALDNVTDSVIYDQCGLPQPGRALRLQFRLG